MNKIQNLLVTVVIFAINTHLSALPPLLPNSQSSPSSNPPVLHAPPMSPKPARRRAPRATARKSVTPVATDPSDAVPELPPQNDAEKTTAEPTGEPSPAPENSAATAGEDSNPRNDTVLETVVKEEVAQPQSGSSSETLGQPDEPVKDSETKVDNEGENGVKEVAGTENSGKGKKTVKKTVKVVKKVIKKVPKKVVKGEGEGKVENLGEVSNPNSTISNSNASGSVEVEEEEKKVVVDEKKDDLVSQDEKDKKLGESMEVENDESGSRVQTENMEGKIEDENEEKEKEGEEDEGEGNVGEKEDELGDGKLFSGELEAMERKKRRKTEIFIGGLDKDAKEEDVRKVFQGAGEIVDLRVVMNSKTGKNKGFAFLRYASAADAKRALEMFAKVEICGKQCGATPVEGNDTIYLGNIDKKWKDEDVLKLLQEMGIENIDKVTVMIDPSKSECNRGFAFVEFETSKDAQDAYKKLQKKDVFGKNLNVKVAWAEPLKELDEEEMLKVKTVYAEFIPSSWDEEKVRDTFKKFGEIDDIVLARNLRTTKRKDFAFISYKTREAAVKCIELFSRELNEDGTKVNVKVSLAKPIQRGKKTRPVVKPAVKEVPNKKPKTSHSSSRSSELRNRAQPMVPHYDVRMNQRSSTNAELVHLLREQASWRPSHAGLSNSPIDVHYSNSLPGRKRHFSMMEADPLYPEVSRYPYSRLDASFPVASSSHNVLHPSGLSSSRAYQQERISYPSGSVYGTRSYPGDTEFTDRAPGSSSLYRRY